jgi:hypothetical protein
MTDEGDAMEDECETDFIILPTQRNGLPTRITLDGLHIVDHDHGPRQATRDVHWHRTAHTSLRQYKVDHGVSVSAMIATWQRHHGPLGNRLGGI